MNKFAELLNSVQGYNEILNSIKTNSTVVNGVSEVQKRHFAFSVSEALSRPFVFVVQNDMEVEDVINDLTFFCKKDVYFFPEENLIFSSSVKSKDIYIKRAEIFEKLLNGVKPNIVITTGVLLNTFPKLNTYKDSVILIENGKEYNIDELSKSLVECGYERSDMVEGVGQFAVRGGILDIFSPTSKNPVRIEFFDDEVDSIRTFDIMSQRTIEQCDSTKIFPVKSDSDDKQQVSFLEYLSEDYLVFLEEPQRILDKIDTFLFEYQEKLDKDGKENLPEKVFSHEEIFNMLFKRKAVFLATLETRLKEFSAVTKHFLLSREIAGFGNSFENLCNMFKEWQGQGYRVILLSGTETKGRNVCDELNKENINAIYSDTLERLPNRGSIYVIKGNLSGGFEYPDAKVAVVSDNDLFGVDKKKKVAKKKGVPIKVDELKVGDYVVHEKHGIGIYLGIETLKAADVIKDYVKISYAKEDMLYIPINQLDSITKYIGADGKVPRISRMGGQDWAKVKAKVRSGLKDVADNLVKLYAKREMAKGFAFSKDTVWQSQFEDAFMYEETEDQLRCIDEIKRDMERARPMDRLLCGDVGYGKTEVAIRAAFKAVMDGKQVAYLAPTTVLASQHYHSFIKRMKDFPVKVQVISRLRSAKEQREILKQLKAGYIDVLIGTHRLIQKDVIFKDLGLLIIDEEQKFGVMDKEKIKMMKENVDVLTLTATPIPRTLHMSMVGVKDVSVIYEPPSDRNPVQTYVFEYDRNIVREAIVRELERKGQVYYLYNKVEDIERVANKIVEDVPWARVAYAHGKMQPSELEDIMMHFSEGEIDVLICTTIIDTGVDIPNVNTIIMENAENLGLSQLYQLKGRVGRSNRIAYAYITYRKDKTLSEISTKRLNAIREFTEFGSGFKIAMRDLEIRGAGNLIGAEQHGHMDAVGYETYCKILESMIRELKGESVEMEEKEPTKVDLDINAYISEKYIKSDVQKMEMYQKISKVENEEELLDITDELADRYGDIPKETLRLLKVVEIKFLGNKLGVDEISKNNSKVIFKLLSANSINMEKLSNVMKDMRGKIMFSAGEKPYITMSFEDDEDELLKNVKFLLQSIN